MSTGGSWLLNMLGSITYTTYSVMSVSSALLFNMLCSITSTTFNAMSIGGSWFFNMLYSITSTTYSVMSIVWSLLISIFSTIFNAIVNVFYLFLSTIFNGLSTCTSLVWYILKTIYSCITNPVSYMFKIINFIFRIIIEIRQLSTIYLILLCLIILVIYYIISIYKSKMNIIIETVIKQIITISKNIDKNRLHLFMNSCISVIMNILKPIMNILKPIMNILKKCMFITSPVVNVLKPYIISLMFIINKKAEKYKLFRIIKNKVNVIKNVVKNNKNNKVDITNNDIKLLIKLVSDTTINRNVYDKLIGKYNKNRVEKYNIYNNKINDKNMKKDLEYLETLIKKKLDIIDARLFIVILLYYVKNSPNF